jgi:hypothetical protein
MESPFLLRALQRPFSLTAAAMLLGVGFVGGCASPGPPRAPSLNLPAEVTGLSALRRGDVVELRFTAPQRNTDHLPLRGDSLKLEICRVVERGACVTLPGSRSLTRLTGGQPTEAIMRDALPDALATGAPRLLAYRVELFNPVGHTAGFSQPVFTLAGAAPAPVARLVAYGSRLGIVLSWQAAAAEDAQVTFRREDLAPGPSVAAVKKPKQRKSFIPVATRTQSETKEANIVWLAAPQTDSMNKLLDTSAIAGDPYQYVAERQRTVEIGGRTLEMRSERSAAVVYVLHDVYPPPAPTDLTAAVFPVDPEKPAAGEAVDLIWQPVDSPNLRGYIVTRQALSDEGKAIGAAVRLTPSPVALPAFHDKLLPEGKKFRYSVTAVDEKGNESAAAVTAIDRTE